MVMKQKCHFNRHCNEGRCPFGPVTSSNHLVKFTHSHTTLSLIQSTVGSHPRIELSSRLATIIPGSSPMIFPKSNHAKNPIIKNFEKVGSSNNYSLLLSAINENQSVHLPKYASVPCPICEPELGHTLDISGLTRPNACRKDLGINVEDGGHEWVVTKRTSSHSQPAPPTIRSIFDIFSMVIDKFV